MPYPPAGTPLTDPSAAGINWLPAAKPAPFVPFKIGPDGIPVPDTNPVASGMDPTVAAGLGFGAPGAFSNAPMDAATMALIGQIGAGSPSSPNAPSPAPSSPLDEATKALVGSAFSQGMTTPTGARIGTLDRAGDALAALGGNIQGGNVGFPDAVSQLNALKGQMAGAAYPGSGAPPMSPFDVTKTLGGDWSGRRNGTTGIPGIGAPVAPKSPAANMPPGELIGGEWVPGGAPPPIPPSLLADSRGSDSKRQADILAEEAVRGERPFANGTSNPLNPVVARDQQREALARQAVTGRAGQIAEARTLRQSGMNPQDAANLAAMQHLINSGGGGMGADGQIPAWMRLTMPGVAHDIAGENIMSQDAGARRTQANADLAREQNTSHAAWAAGLQQTIQNATANSMDVAKAERDFRSRNPEPTLPGAAQPGAGAASIAPEPNNRGDQQGSVQLTPEQVNMSIKQMMAPAPGIEPKSQAHQAIDYLDTLSQSNPKMVAGVLALHPELRQHLSDLEYDNNPALWSVNHIPLPVSVDVGNDQEKRKALANIMKSRRLLQLGGWKPDARITGELPSWAAGMK